MKLDEYQKKVTRDTYKAVANKVKGTMLQMPTGSGKTEVGIALLKLHHKCHPDKVHAWLTHREELRSQSSNRIERTKLPVVVMNDFKATDRHWYQSSVNIFSPQLRSYPYIPSSAGLLIVDEAHHTPANSWGSFIANWQHSGGQVVGLTATPWRMSKTQGFEHWYQELVKGPSMSWLQEHNYLATPRVVNPAEALLDKSDAKILTTGDYAFDWMENSVLKLLEHQPVIDHWHRFTADMEDKRTMWFTPTVDCAYALQEVLGDDSVVLIGETSREVRHKYLDRLRNKQLTHLISVDVLSEGLDIPSVPIIATLRPTKSLVVWLQQCGRASRVKGARGVEGGTYYVLDYANNASEHGVPDADREWFLEPRSKTEGKMPFEVVASCYRCREVTLHPASRECWNCGARQYHQCEACHVDRRWTRFKKKDMLVCDLCRKAREEKDRIKQNKRPKYHNHYQNRYRPQKRYVLKIKEYQR